LRDDPKDDHGLAPRVVKDFNFLADDGLVDALLMEVADLLRNLIEYQRPGSIDLLGLPLSASCLAAFARHLGEGEISISLRVSGESEIKETQFPGVWWTSHKDETGRVVAMLIEVAVVPEILRADPADMEQGYRRLADATNFSAARRSR
jgi:hydrogenase-1 operon protein HyaF